MPSCFLRRKGRETKLFQNLAPFGENYPLTLSLLGSGTKTEFNNYTKCNNFSEPKNFFSLWLNFELDWLKSFSKCWQHLSGTASAVPIVTNEFPAEIGSKEYTVQMQ
jgi:hypothetical protein